MKKFLKVFILSVSLLLGITTMGVADELSPSDVTIEGNKIHFVHTNDGDKVFMKNLNMIPGEVVKEKLTIKNDGKEPFEVFLRGEKIGRKEKYNLCDVLNLNIDYDGKSIYRGRVTGENGLANNISLGVVNPGEKKILCAKVELDKNATDNRYKNKRVDGEWIFTAVGESGKTLSSEYSPDKGINIIDEIKNKLPKTGYEGMFKYGIALMVLGGGVILILNKKKREEEGS